MTALTLAAQVAPVVALGMSRDSGRALPLQSDAHLEQSVQDILTTPLGSRPMRRDYGSEIPTLIDQPLNALTRMRLFAAAAAAILRFEPRVRLRRLALDVAPTGAARLRLALVRVDRPAPSALSLSVSIGQATASA